MLRSIKNSQLLAVLSLFVLGLCTFTQAWAETAIPAHTAPVVDKVGILSPQVKNQLNVALENLYRQGGSQVAVLVIQSLDGEPIESYSIRVVEQWKLGTAEKDNGILLSFSMQDRALRIEVGGGLEGDLTDLAAKRIIDNEIFPRMRQQDYDAAVIAGLRGILAKTDPQFDLNSSLPQVAALQQPSEKSGTPLPVKIFMMFWFIGLIMAIFGKRGRRGGIYHGGGWGGGSSGGGFGGGGFSGGGGGGFSGGGASGRW